MATVLVKNGSLVSAGTTVENELLFNNSQMFTKPITTAFIEVISGTIQFSSGEAIAAEHQAWGAGSKFPLSFRHEVANIRFKQASGADSFVITV